MEILQEWRKNSWAGTTYPDTLNSSTTIQRNVVKDISSLFVSYARCQHVERRRLIIIEGKKRVDGL